MRETGGLAHFEDGRVGDDEISALLRLAVALRSVRASAVAGESAT